MFLPKSLPTALLQLSKKTEIVNKPPEINNNSQIVTLNFPKMVSLRKKRNQTDNNSKGAPTVVVATTTSNATIPNRSLLTRGWERLSRRKKRAKQTALPAQQQQPAVNKPSTSGAFPDAWEEATFSNGASTSGATQQCSNRNTPEEDSTRKHFLHRGMDRIRRSFRRGTSSASNKKGAQALTGGRGDGQQDQPSSSGGSSLNGGGLSSNGHTGKNYCQSDEASVRSAACSFNVKYLGCCEVYESRGMHVCEGALQHLRAKKRATKSILYVSGDGIRVVDQDKNRGGLILDQTIEKVSFCAPDRHNDKGFAYICRDGATRRWMCHAFQSTKESGERLSHAVGCAFNVCLEKKKKRDAETAAYKSAQAIAAANNGADTSGLNVDWDSVEPVCSAARNNAAYNSFRRSLSIAERKIDPQTAIIHNPPPPPNTSGNQQPMGTHALPSQSTRNSLTLSTQIGLNSSFSMDECSSVAKPRPVANPSLFERQGSFKAPVQTSSQSSSSFKRFNSLRSGFDLSTECQDMFGLPASTLKTLNGTKTLHNEPIYEGDDDEVDWPAHQHSTTVYTQIKASTPPPIQSNGTAGSSISNSDVAPWNTMPNSLSLQNFGNNPVNNSQQQMFRSPLWSTSVRTTSTPQNTNVQKEEQGNGTDNRSARSMHTSISLTGFDNGFANWGDNQSSTARSTKADDWLEQAFKATMTFPSPSLVPNGQQQHNQSNFAASQTPPPLPPNQVSIKNCASSEKGQPSATSNASQRPNIASSSNQGHSRKASGGAVRLSIEYQLLEETDAPPQSPPTSSKSLSFHVPSQQTEAYNLEKLNTPQSSYSTPTKPKRSLQERTIYGDDDPFDVHWSTIVLQNSSSSKNCSSPASSIAHSTSNWDHSLPSTSHGNKGEPLTSTATPSFQTNPFSSESTPSISRRRGSNLATPCLPTTPNQLTARNSYFQVPTAADHQHRSHTPTGFVVLGNTNNSPRNSKDRSEQQTNMCGIVPNAICRFSELAPSQFGLTKQLVLRIALPHITLLVVSVGYAILGCWILTVINYSDGDVTGGGGVAVQLIIEAKQHLISQMWSQMKKTGNTSDDDKWSFSSEMVEKRKILKRLMTELQFMAKLLRQPNQKDFLLHEGLGQENKNSNRKFVLEFAEQLHRIYMIYPRAPSLVQNIKGKQYIVKYPSPSLNVTWNLFFTTTCLTSIGYGANAPTSFIGRLFIVLFISFGIPLYLVTLADLAKFCTEGMNRTYTEFIQLKFQVGRWLKRRWKAGFFHQFDSYTRMGSEINHVEEVIIAGGEEELAEFLWTHLEKTKFVEVPFVLVYLILLSYIGFASYLIAYLENWTLSDGFYFVMMSLHLSPTESTVHFFRVLTVGFGDLMPSNDQFLLVTLAIILVGLIVTTTCIDIVGAYYIDQLHFFGRRLDTEDPLEWLKAVQLKRIEAMKREAMRSYLNHEKLESFSLTNSVQEIQLPEPPKPPRGILAFHATAESVCLRWDPPVKLEEGKRFWYTLSYKTRTPQRRNHYTVVDFITKTHYEVVGLKSFTLYEFSIVTTTRFGTSKPSRCQEYTEPCTVPQLLKLEAISSETATISWRAPRKNNGTENYTLMFAQEPAPQFRHWQRFDIGKRKRFTLTELNNDTRYICCVLAQHNFGLAAMSKSLRFKTRSWWYDEDSVQANQPGQYSRKGSTAVSLGRKKSTQSTLNKQHSYHLAPPNWRYSLRKASSRDPMVEEERDEDAESAHKNSITSSEYQIT
uniref:Uncharacterized protein n=1 Tax=Ditylenchus dipsaci TaxID=166011 RepID=A0A915D819_9BILA